MIGCQCVRIKGGRLTGPPTDCALLLEPDIGEDQEAERRIPHHSPNPSTGYGPTVALAIAIVAISIPVGRSRSSASLGGLAIRPLPIAFVLRTVATTITLTIPAVAGAP